MKILSPAKINLFLRICGKRPDGYHELVSLMCCVDLYDEVALEYGAKKIAVRCSNPKVPQDATNLAHQAASLFQNRLEIKEGVKIDIHKKIPVAAGLGGGSSNAASVLVGLNRHYGYPFSQDQLMSTGLAIGTDVPFFIFQKPAIATGIGEKLEAFPGELSYHILLIYPGFSVSTADAYRNLNLGLTKDEKKHTNFHLNNDEFDAAYHLCNDLEKVSAAKYPEISFAKKKLLSLGAKGALMSGSGPTVFGLFTDLGEAHRAKQALAHDHKKWQVFLADMILDSGPKIIDP